MSVKILVIGGKGKTGRHVVQKLEERGIDYRIATRSPNEKNDVSFDWMEPKKAVHAFEGIDRLYIVAPTNSSDHGVIVPPILEAAKKLGVQRFVLLSASSLEMGGVMMGQVHDWIAKNTSEWAVLRPTWFMQNFSEQQHHPTIRDEGMIYSATGEGEVGFIDADDIAEVAVQALIAEKSWNTDYILTGPELLSYTNIAEILTKALNKKIVHKKLTKNELINRFKNLGFDDDYAQLLAEMDINISKGFESKLTNNVEKLTGKVPRSFNNFSILHKNRWLLK